MKRNCIIILALLGLFLSCDKDYSAEGLKKNKVLLLQVDYQTNIFEGGFEKIYPTHTATFTITNEYQAPGDFGGILFKYDELKDTLFNGSIIWAGTGRMMVPKALLPAAAFDSVKTADILMPAAGFENLFNPGNYPFDYAPVWNAVQKLTKVREYLASNPDATVKLFLYTPSVGAGNPADWNWIVFMKN